MSLLPKDFVTIRQASEADIGTIVNVIGVVADLVRDPLSQQAPKLSSRGEWMLTFKLLDQSLLATQDYDRGFTVRFFRRDQDSLPRVRNIGDVVLIKSIKMSNFAGQRLALSHFSTSTLVFPGGSIPDPTFMIGYQGSQRIECLGAPIHVANLTLNEQQYVISMRHALKDIVANVAKPLIASASVLNAQAASLPAKPKLPPESSHTAEPPAKKQRLDRSLGPKFKLISELKVPKSFADLCGIVVKRIGTSYGDCDLYITDYTANDQVRYYPPPEEETEQERDGDDFGYNGPPRKTWPGPYEFFVLKVNVKEPHASFANQYIQEGDCVILRNVKVRITPNGDWLEGDLWHDYQNKQKLNIAKVTNQSLPELQAVQRRKENYWAKREALLSRGTETNPPKQTKAEKKRLKKQRQKANKKQRTAPDIQSHADSSSSSSDEEESAPSKPAPTTSNPYIRCSDGDISLTPIKHILDPHNLYHTNRAPDGRTYDLPFINAKYRAKVRVVDFSPKNLQDFATQSIPTSSNPAEEGGTDWSYTSTSLSSPSWEWSFSLTLEDATVRPEHRGELDRIEVQVHHDQAQFLLGNRLGDPGDMSGNGSLLSQLRERLFILWGNLEEVQRGEGASGSSGNEENGKGERVLGEVSNLPFDCCIMEYGVEMDEDDPERWDEEGPVGQWKRLYGMFGATIL
jgi:hypothetical protein